MLAEAVLDYFCHC